MDEALVKVAIEKVGRGVSIWSHHKFGEAVKRSSSKKISWNGKFLYFKKI